MTIPSLRRSVLVWNSLPTLLLVIFFLSAFAVRAEASGSKQPTHKKDYAVIVGTVWGPDDHPLYAVKVKIRRAKDKKAKWEVYSDHNGEFAQRFPVGEADYVLTADLKDFKSNDGKPLHQAQEVTVHIYNNERIDIGLHLTH